jgi:branched-chain amino acid aminotransferase
MGLQERKISPQDLHQSEEVFLTNSLIEIMPLTKIGDRFVNKGKPGEKTKLILDKYRKLIKGGYK